MSNYFEMVKPGSKSVLYSPHIVVIIFYDKTIPQEQSVSLFKCIFTHRLTDLCPLQQNKIVK